MSDANQRPAGETALVDRILAGDDGAWKAFCEIYSPAIERSIRRCVNERETARDLYVSLLEKLKRGTLGTYRGASTLSAWLYVVSRNHCRDYYRSASGVRHVTSMLKGLGRDERRFFELYYLEGLSMDEASESLRVETGRATSRADVVGYDEAIRRKIAGKQLAKLSGRLLRPDAARRFETSIETLPEGKDLPDTAAVSPEESADAGRLGGVLEKLRAAIAGLSARERLMLELRFEHGLSLRETGELLDLGDARRVHEQLSRLLDRLRESLRASGISGELVRELLEALDRSGAWRGIPSRAIFPEKEPDARE
jgi:RNA polymerase sigma factor (sigma-70 family)